LGRLGPQERSSKELLSALLELSGSGALLVQSRLLNHPELTRFGGSGLISLRLLSGFGPGEVMPIRAVLSLPYRDSINSQDGFKAAVDVIDGRLGRIFHISADQRFFPRLPGTDVLIEGAYLPCWPEVLYLVERAHNVLPDYAFLGWDVAICGNGPVMLEANGNFGASGLQKSGPRPLIDEKFLEVFEYWRERRKANRLKGERVNG